MTREHGILAEILQEAKDEYIEAQKDKISIFVSDRYNRCASFESTFGHLLITVGWQWQWLEGTCFASQAPT